MVPTIRHRLRWIGFPTLYMKCEWEGQFLIMFFLGLKLARKYIAGGCLILTRKLLISMKRTGYSKDFWFCFQRFLGFQQKAWYLLWKVYRRSAWGFGTRNGSIKNDFYCYCFYCTKNKWWIHFWLICIEMYQLAQAFYTWNFSWVLCNCSLRVAVRRLIIHFWFREWLGLQLKVWPLAPRKGTPWRNWTGSQDNRAERELNPRKLL